MRVNVPKAREQPAPFGVDGFASARGIEAYAHLDDLAVLYGDVSFQRSGTGPVEDERVPNEGVPRYDRRSLLQH